MVEVSRSQDLSIGDGTTSVVLVAASLLENALPLIERHAVAIRHILAAYRYACQCTVELANHYAFAPTLHGSNQWLHSIARTCLAAKMTPLSKQLQPPPPPSSSQPQQSASELEHFAAIAVEAVLLAATIPILSATTTTTTATSNTLLQYIKIDKRLGSLKETRVLHGIVVGNVCQQQQQQQRRRAIVLIHTARTNQDQVLHGQTLHNVPIMAVHAFPSICGVTQRQSRVWESEQQVQSLEQGNDLARMELQLIQDTCTKIIESGAKVVVAKALMHSSALQYVVCRRLPRMPSEEC
jgi:hypothetical protein